MKKLEGIEVIPCVLPYVDKLSNSRKKLKRVDMLVQNTQERVANVQRMHAQLLAFEKSQKVVALQSPPFPPSPIASLLDALLPCLLTREPAQDRMEGKPAPKQDAPAGDASAQPETEPGGAGEGGAPAAE